MIHPSFRGSPSSPRIGKYSVFLSFRGRDVRNNFVSHLFPALQREYIVTFRDDKSLEKGKPTEFELFKAIDQSPISFVILSKNYPESLWCLNEAAKASDKISEPGCSIVPIFVGVDKSEVQNQSGKYKEYFDQHERDFSDDIGKVQVQRWRLALTQIASLPGHDVGAKLESDVIDEIVNDANSRLNHRLSGAEEFDREVLRILEVNFVVGLEKNVKDIFVDVVCFFKGADEKYVTKILEPCGFNPEIGIRDLCKRSLLKIVNGRLWMNDILQELGWKIAKGEFPNEPAKWSRLWSYKDIQTVETGTEKVEAIVLSPDDLQETPLKAEVLSQMSRLRLIIFPNNVKFSGNLNSLSNELRLLSWSQFPFSSLPSSFEPDKLVELIMHDSNIIQLWEGEKRLPNLRNMDLRGSKSLIKIPNVKGVANLERLDLEGCTGLLEVDPSVGGLKRIKFVNLRNCHSLTSIPKTLLLSTFLGTLNLSGCYGLAKCLNGGGLAKL